MDASSATYHSSQVYQIPFQELNEEHFKAVHLIYQGLQYQFAKKLDKGYIFDDPKYEGIKKLPAQLGRIFFAFDEDKIIGYLISFDSLGLVDFSSHKKYPAQMLSKILKHEWVFIRDLSFVGHFSFIDQFGVAKTHQGQGIGRDLLEAFEVYSKDNKAILLAAAIHEKNRYALEFLNKRQYRIVDFYPNNTPDNNTVWWFRVINMVQQSAFLKAINSASLPLNFNTTIPIQLNLATQHVNKLLSWIDARILWSSFFHYQNDILSKVFQLEKNYNGYYDTLLSCPRAAFPKVVNALKEMILYLKDKDENGIKWVPSLSPVMLKEGFEFFLFNDEIESHQFPSFTKPNKFNIHHLDIHSILSKLDLNYRLEPYTHSENNYWGEIHRQMKEKYPSPEVKLEWEKWKREKWLSDQEVDLVNKANQRGTTNLNGEDRSRWQIIKARKRLPESERKKWEYWIHLHKIIFEADKESKYYQEGQTIWCHVVIPMSFSGGLSGVMFSFVVRKKDDSRFSRLLNDLCYTISNAFAKNMFNILFKLQNNITTRHLMRYAIATVMTRNLSHNLGSHVLSKVASQSILRRYVSAIGRNRIGGLEHVAQLNAYLRTRMDFLADVSTSDPVTSLPRLLDREIISKFRKEKILLENISSSDIRAIHLNFDCRLHKEEDVMVQIPNGDLGNHAFYILLENLIRNVIKHEHKTFKERDSLSITIRVEEGSAGFAEDYYKVTLFDDVLRPPQSRELINRISHKFINRKSFNENHEIRHKGLGIMEMKIATSYLRGKLPAKFVDTHLSPPLLKVVPIKSNPKEQSFFLGYEFYLKKPQELLIIGNLPAFEPPYWINKGILIRVSNDLKMIRQTFYTHNFIVILDSKGKQLITPQTKVLPLRHLDFSAKEQKEKFLVQLRQNSAKAVYFCWKTWITQLLLKENISQARLEIHLSMTKRFEEIRQLPVKALMLFDQHGDCSQFQSDGSRTVDPAQLYYYEACSSNSPTGIIIRHLEQYEAEEQELIRLQLIEAAMTRVIILDERIQKVTAEAMPMTSIGHSSSIEQLEWMNISIPTIEEVNLNQRDFGASFQNKWNQWLEGRLKRHNIHFLVIHLGLLEKLVGTRPTEIQSYLEKLVKKHASEVEIVLISGRGKASELPNMASFLNYSNVSDYVTTARSKFHLCKVLYSARARTD